MTAPIVQLASCPRCGGDVANPHSDNEPYCLQCGWYDRDFSPAMILDIDEEVLAHVGYNTIGKYSVKDADGFALTYPGMKIREA